MPRGATGSGASRGIGFQPVALEMTGWKLIPLQERTLVDRLAKTHMLRQGIENMKFIHNSPLIAIAFFFQVILFLGISNCLGQQPVRSAKGQANSSQQLPKVLSVESMLRSNTSVEGFLSRTSNESAYEKASYVTESRTRASHDDTQWNDSMAGWTSPDFYTLPLYFEQSKLERYESFSPEWTRPVVSYAQFLASIPVMPYKTGVHGPRDRVYTVGHYPSGTRAPSRSWGPLSKRGMILQGVATTGMIFFIP